jgi:hypothetical protein
MKLLVSQLYVARICYLSVSLIDLYLCITEGMSSISLYLTTYTRTIHARLRLAASRC